MKPFSIKPFLKHMFFVLLNMLIPIAMLIAFSLGHNLPQLLRVLAREEAISLFLLLLASAVASLLVAGIFIRNIMGANMELIKTRLVLLAAMILISYGLASAYLSLVALARPSILGNGF